MKSFYLSILLSFIENIVAAVIFWFAFSRFPKRSRYNKLRPKLEFQMHQAYSTLFSLFDLVMQHASRSPSFFQAEIRGARLQRYDIECGLQNKCLNSSYLYDTQASAFLMPIGEELYRKLEYINKITNRLFQFSTFMSTNEITCLEKIRSKLEPYSLEKHEDNVSIFMGDKQLLPINPSLSYLAASLTELYQLFCELQEMILSNKYQDRNTLFDKVQSLFYQERFSACKRFIRKASVESVDDRTWLRFYLFMCENKIGNDQLARYELEELLKSKPNLLYCRNFLGDVISDPSIMAIAEEFYTRSQINEMLSMVTSEKQQRDAFIEHAGKLKNYYSSKTTAL